MYNFSMAPQASKAGKIGIGIFVVVGFLCFVGWRAMQPKIHKATMAEIRAVLPPELLVVDQVDVQAQERYKKLVAISQKIDAKESASILDSKKVAPDVVFAAVKKFWQAHPTLTTDLTVILSERIQSIQGKQAGPFGFTSLSTIKNLSKVLTTSARLYADHKEYAQSTKLHLLSIALGDRLMSDGGQLIDYLVAVAVDAIAMRSITLTVNNAGFPLEDTRTILGALHASPQVDENLASGIRRDFQGMAMPLLPDPTKDSKVFSESFATNPVDDSPGKADNSIVGSYEPIETARASGNAVLSSMNNARRPFSQYDGSIATALDADEKGLPQEVDPEKEDGFEKTWGQLKYRFLMNNGHNTLGRLLTDNMISGQGAIQASCRSRALRDALRVYLGSIVYRAAHNGNLPKTSAGFISILGAWPQDPYNGKQMIYDPWNQKAYTVGPDLIDNGGDVNFDLSGCKDIGISLKR